MKKRIISWLVLTSILFTSIPFLGVTANAALLTENDLYNAVITGSIGEENYNIYLAWYHTIMNSDGRDTQLQAYCQTLLYNRFAEIYEAETFRTTIMTTWAGLGNRVSKELKEEDLYTSLLYTMILGNISGDNSSFELYNDFSLVSGDFLTPLFSEMCKIVSASTEAELVAKISTVSESELEEIIAQVKNVEENGKNISKEWDKLGSFFEILTIVMNTAETIIEVRDRIYQINAILEANKYLEQILLEILSNSQNNMNIREAANDLYNYMNTDDYTEQLNRIVKGEIAKGARQLAGDLFTFLLNDIFAQVVPGLALGKAAADILLGMSAEGESIFIILSLTDMEEAIFRAAETMRKKFVSQQSVDNAYLYITAMDMCHRFAYLTCDYMNSHLQSMYEKGLIKELITNKDNYNTYKSILESSRENIIRIYNDFYSIPRQTFDECLAKLNSMYKVSYDVNGGTNTPPSHSNNVGDTLITSAVPVRTGYIFMGWSEDQHATEATYKHGGVNVIKKEGDITLYAVWQAGTFNIVFHANGGKYSDNSTSKTLQKVYLQNFTINLEQPTREGYKFTGVWTLNADGTGNKYTHGNTYSDIGGAGLTTKHLYAVWKDTECVVEYDYNDGTGSQPIKDTVNTEATPKYSVKEPNKDKNLFKGWMFQDPNGEYWWTDGNWDNGKVSIIQPGDSLQLSGDLTLYAKWDYYVHYDHGTGYVHEVVRNGQGYVVDSPSYKNGNKVFDRWKCTSSNGSISYYIPGDTVNLTSDMTLVAVWIDPADILSGDINGDNKVNNKDLYALQKYLAGDTISVKQEALDVDGNGTVDNADFTRLHQYLSGYNVRIYP